MRGRSFCKTYPAPQYETHISILPMEMLIEIFRWVISSYIDLNSMRNMALVCKWFYACSRTDVLWRAMCMRVWGGACLFPSSYDYNWRRMYLELFHIEYSGIYIRNASCIENSQYYKYLRFFPDGTVTISLTKPAGTANTPMTKGKREVALQIAELAQTKSSTISRGHFRQDGDMIHIEASYSFKSRLDEKTSNCPKREARVRYFYLTLSLGRDENRTHCHLDWTRYSVETLNKITGLRITNKIEAIKYKTFQFVPISSYTAKIHAPL